MSWYAAHLVLYVKLKEHPQDRFPLWENIVLVQANSEEEALAKAEHHGREDEGDDGGTFRWDGKPAQWVFAGVRKLTACQDATKRPTAGTEITYIEMEATTQALAKLLRGEPASVRLVDHFGVIIPAETEPPQAAEGKRTRRIVP